MSLSPRCAAPFNKSLQNPVYFLVAFLTAVYFCGLTAFFYFSSLPGGPGDRVGGYEPCRMANGEAGSGPFWGKPEWCGEDGYYKMLASSYANLLASGKSGAIRHCRMMRTYLLLK